GGMVVPYRRWPKGAAAFHDMMRRATHMSATAAHEIGMIDALADDYAGLITEAVARVHALAGRPGRTTAPSMFSRRRRSNRWRRTASGSVPRPLASSTPPSAMLRRRRPS